MNSSRSAGSLLVILVLTHSVVWLNVRCGIRFSPLFLSYQTQFVPFQKIYNQQPKSKGLSKQRSMFSMLLMARSITQSSVPRSTSPALPRFSDRLNDPS